MTNLPNSNAHAVGATAARKHGVIAFLLLAAAATAVTAPMWFLGNASGHDFQFHMASWLEVAGQWREGILYPRWAEWANFGFGEPRFIFYPPLSWMLGAALGTVLPWKIVPGAYIWLTLVLGGIGAWKFARDWLPPTQAAAAALFYAVNPYILIIVYYRSDFAELLACAILPFVLWRALHVVRDGWIAVPGFAALFAAVWLANAPAAVIATYSLVLVFAVGAFYARRLRPLLAGGIGMACGFGLASSYILPAAWEQRWVQISQALVALLEPKDNFIFTHAADPEFLFFNWKVSTVAMTMILITAIAAVFVARQRRTLGFAWWQIVAVGALATLLMFPVSALAWALLPKLAFVQFPWRWLGPLGFAFAFFLAAAPITRRQQIAAWASAAVLTGALATAIVSDCWWDSEDIPVLSGGISSGNGYEGTDEYQPVGSDRYSLPGSDVPYGETPGKPAPLVDFMNDDGNRIDAAGSARVTRWSADQKEFTFDAEDDTEIGVRLLKYPAWRTTVDGATVPTNAASEDGEMLIDLPAGKHDVRIEFVRTTDRTAGGAISIVFVLGVGGWWIVVRRRSPGRAVASRSANFSRE